MPFVKYTVAQRAEAIALAEVLGLSAASDQLGIEERAIREWMRRAGRSPADAIEPASWERIARLALTKAEHLVAEGKLSAAQLLNVSSMAATRAAAEPKASSSAAAVADKFDDWLCERAAAEVATEADCVPLADAIEAVPRELMRRANLEDDQPHREAMLAWFSRNPEIPAGDVLAWAQAQTEDLIARHGSLRGWHDHRLAIERSERIISARALVLAQSGLPLHEAYQMARDISDDLIPRTA